jgi:hypothetical protein
MSPVMTKVSSSGLGVISGPSKEFGSLLVFDHPRHAMVVSSVLGHVFSNIWFHVNIHSTIQHTVAKVIHEKDRDL